MQDQSLHELTFCPLCDRPKRKRVTDYKKRGETKKKEKNPELDASTQQTDYEQGKVNVNMQSVLQGSCQVHRSNDEQTTEQPFQSARNEVFEQLNCLYILIPSCWVRIFFCPGWVLCISFVLCFVVLQVALKGHVRCLITCIKVL